MMKKKREDPVAIFRDFEAFAEEELYGGTSAGFDALDEADQLDVVEMLSACDMSEVLDLRLSRAIGRHNNLEVWL